jgi:hypothetical protein
MSTDGGGDCAIGAIKYGDKKVMQWEVSATEAEVSEEEASQCITTALVIWDDALPPLPGPTLCPQEPKIRSEKKIIKVGYPKVEIRSRLVTARRQKQLAKDGAR